jgi:extradiol dioxygenase family protein
MKIFLDHLVLNVFDVTRAMTFYTEVIGFKPERWPEFLQSEVPFPSVRINKDTVIDLFPPKLWRKDNGSGKASNNLNHFCLTLSYRDWQALQTRLAANQITIERGPVDNWGAKGEGISIYFHDTEGNEIEARYYPEQS